MGLQIRYALIAAAAVLLASLVYNDLPGFGSSAKEEPAAAPTVQIKEQTVRVEIVDTPEKRTQGLSGREGLAEDEGMLFVFEENARHSFWMKDMRFAIDIIWISSEGIIVDIARDVTPESYPEVFTPQAEARFVLELPAGHAEQYGVQTGDVVRF